MGGTNFTSRGIKNSEHQHPAYPSRGYQGNMAEEHADCEFFSPVRLLLIVPGSLAQTEMCLSFNSTGRLALEECAFISTWTIGS
jgi:hypothetical protein